MNFVGKLLGTAAILTVAASPALAETCADAMKSWQQEALKDGQLLNSVNKGKRAAIFKQRMEKAREYAAAKNEAACLKEVTALKAMTDKEKTYPSYKTPPGSVANTFRTSKPAVTMASGADKSKFIGRPVYDRTGFYAGTVDDVIVVDEKVRYLVVSKGGMIGIVERDYYVPVAVIRANDAGDAFMIGTTRDEFYKMPSATPKDRARKSTDKTFQQDLDDRYKGISKFGQ